MKQCPIISNIARAFHNNASTCPTNIVGVGGARSNVFKVFYHYQKRLSVTDTEQKQVYCLTIDWMDLSSWVDSRPEKFTPPIFVHSYATKGTVTPQINCLVVSYKEIIYYRY